MTTFRALEVTSRVATPGAESAIYDCLVLFLIFTARCYASAVLAMGLRLSVCLCLSQVRVLLKRQNVGSHKQYHTIPQGL